MELKLRELDAHIKAPTSKLLQDVTISPQLAGEILLLYNHGNRNQRETQIDYYVKQMKNGAWMNNTGDSIRFSDKHRLIDGQHRLAAIVKSGVSIRCNLQTGLNDDVFTVLDNGKNRNSADVLTIAGYGDSGVLAQAVKTVISYDRRQMTKGTKAVKQIERATSAEILDWLRSNSKDGRMEIFVEESKVYHKQFKRLQKQTFAAFLYLFGRENLKQAREFLSMLASGDNISATKNSAIYQLRQKLINHLEDRENIDMVYRYAIIIKAWNYWRRGQQISVLRYDRGKFPEIE